MHRYNAVLFDLDGTLLDTAPDLFIALNKVLQKMGSPPVIRDEKFNDFVANGSLYLIQEALGESAFQKLDRNTIYQDFMRIYEHHICQETRPYPGVLTLLKKLATSNIPWGIVTNKPESLARNLIQHWSEFSACQVLLGGDTLKWQKPHPAPILHACRKMHILPTQTLYVGDHSRDIQAGRHAWMPTAVAGWGYIPSTDIPHTWLADYHFNTPVDLTHWFFFEN